MNSNVYGKTMEKFLKNSRCIKSTAVYSKHSMINKADIYLVSNTKDYHKLVSRPSLVSQKIYWDVHIRFE